MDRDTQSDVQVAAITEPLEIISQRGFSRYDVFEDWLSLMLLALERRDEPYLEIVERYDQNKDREKGCRNIDHFSTAFGCLMKHMNESERELLGIIYEEFGMSSDEFGQHFTPHSVCELKAKILSDDVEEPPVTIADPACGSGRLLTHAARQYEKKTYCFGRDKDILCAKMSALNACFFNLNAIIICGDSLLMENHRAWRTTSSALGGDIQEVNPDTIQFPKQSLDENESDSKSTAKDAEKKLQVTSDSNTTEQNHLSEWL